MATPSKHAGLGATLQAWFFGGRLRRWGSARSRWLNGGLTVALLLAGVVAWVLALVQPWTVRAADPGIVPVKGQLTPDRMREAAEAASRALDAPAPLVPRLVSRNPFRSAGAPAEPPTAGGEADALGVAPTPREIADVVKDLKLKATVLGPNGQRWAVINGSTYQEGEEVAGLTLVEVREDRARLRRADVTCVLKMD
ncbi:MAG: hypothetical protein ISS74_00755 [Planctomycetes bacterium]|nr:hypothetical protein [Planctomycetota bacterium]